MALPAIESLEPVENDPYLRPGPSESCSAPIDLQALAEKIYALLKHEARLERERLGR